MSCFTFYEPSVLHTRAVSSSALRYTPVQHIIYNYNPIFSGLTGSGFEQVYIF
jgi:hypothetical protein